ncbi:MAG: winged helix-turn-helix domain-containing protein [Euryarchaeota archaeon]|nr:winged helix-turn-helix domain-containing protein [Euryarchaeota archaeon]
MGQKTIRMRTELLKTLTFSKKREKLLLLLKDGPKTLEDIRTSLKVTSSAIIPQIRKLEGQNLVRQEYKNYVLTGTGVLIIEAFNSLVKTIEITQKYEEFWEHHDTKAIPQHLSKRIDELNDCILIESNLNKIYEPHEQFMEALPRSKNVKTISPVFHPSYPSLFLPLAEKGIDVSIILTEEVFERVKNEYTDTLQRYLTLPTARLYVSDEDIRLACGITDGIFCLSLFFKNEGYDPQRDLLSYTHSAIKWGEDLFDHFLKKSKEIKSV